MNTGGRNRAERRLAAILAADVAGYSRLIGADEDGTLDRLRSIRAEVIDPGIATHRGRLVKTTGDGFLIEFASVVDALRCASEWQQAMAGRNAGIVVVERIEFRIGINVGDVVVEDGDIFGDGVNVAARLEALAEPGGICVSARVQEDAAGRLDLAFDDLGDQELKNIARPVRVYRIAEQSPHPSPPPHAGEGVTHAGAANYPPPQSPGQARGGEGRVGAAAPPPLALPDKPSIAVLPFQNMSGDPEQEYFVDGMVEEIITALSRIRWLFVIARNSTFTYKGRAVDVKEVGRELGVRYVLEGSVRKGGNRVRITGQLIDAETGAHLWADRFDGSLEDVFDLQDNVASSVAGVIEPALSAAETARSQRRPVSDLTAYDLYLRAHPLAITWAKDAVEEAFDLLTRAIERDPRYGPALAMAAVCHSQLVTTGRVDDPETSRRQGVALARQAIQVAPDDPNVLTRAALALLNFREDFDSLIVLIDQALALNPSSAFAWFTSAWIKLYAGKPDLAIEHFEISLRLDPRAPARPIYMTGIGGAHFLAQRFDEAILVLLASLQQLPSYPVTYRYLAACYAHMGRLDTAREIVERLRAITPAVISPFYRRDWRHDELLLSGLRLAMGETA